MADLIEELFGLRETVDDNSSALIEGDPGYAEREVFLARIDSCLAEASRVALATAGKFYIHGNTKLIVVNKKLKDEIDSLAEFQANIDAIRGLIDGVEQFLGIFVPGPV